MTWRIGVDIGGTFTDVGLVDEARGGIGVVKVPTTPRDFARGVLDAPARGDGEPRHRGRRRRRLAHATTVVTNALLEGKGARTALITTRGMRDVLELRRSARASLYDLFQDAPAVLVPRHLRLEITERVDAQGAVVRAAPEEERTAIASSSAMSPGRRGVPAVLVPERRPRAGDRRAAARGAARPAGLPVEARCCRRSASSSARARPRCAPMSGPSWPRISARLEAA